MEAARHATPVATPLQSAQVELSCPDEHRTFRMHLSCAALWEAVRVTRGPDPAL
jgi:hypothetical protein